MNSYHDIDKRKPPAPPLSIRCKTSSNGNTPLPPTGRRHICMTPKSVYTYLIFFEILMAPLASHFPAKNESISPSFVNLYLYLIMITNMQITPFCFQEEIDRLKIQKQAILTGPKGPRGHKVIFSIIQPWFVDSSAFICGFFID